MHIIPQSEIYKTLSEYIEPADIPKKYGGQLAWSFGDMPNLDPGIVEGFKWADGGKGLPTGPVKWEKGEGGKMQMVAVGSSGGEKRRTVLGVLDRSWEEAFFAKDPAASSGAEVQNGGVGTDRGL